MCKIILRKERKISNEKKEKKMNSNKKTARIAGILFLLMVIFGVAAELFFRQKIFTSTDVVVISENITSNILLYRLGIVSDLIMTVFFLLTALALYKLLSNVNKHMAAAMVVFATAGTVILMFNILIEIAPLIILTENDYLSNFSAGQQQSLAAFFYNLYLHGYMIGQIFFSLWVLPLGYLIYKSGFIPRIFGILFVFETIFGLMAVIVHFATPNLTVETIMLIPMTIAEFSFMFYLLIRGVNESKLLK